MKEKIKSIVERATRKLFTEIPSFTVEIPPDKKYGHYSCNIAFLLAHQLKKQPIQVANLIKNVLSSSPYFKDIQVAPPGFLNFFVSDKVIFEEIKRIRQELTKNKKKAKIIFPKYKGKKIAVDYTDPNPFKEFHIGHLMSNIIGETLCRLFESQGAEVKRICYQGDVGLHVAKTIWAILSLLKKQFPTDNQPLEQKIKYISKAYCLGTQAWDQGLTQKGESIERVRAEIRELNKKIYEQSDPEVNFVYKKGKEWSLEYFDRIYKLLGTPFDYFIFESQIAQESKRIVENGLKKKIFEKGEKEAIVFKGKKYGLHTRVFVTSEGIPTYEAKDLALSKIKYKLFPYDKSFIVTGNEVNEYFKVVFFVMSKIFPSLARKTEHIGHGMMRLPEGKISSRKGNVITAESLIKTVQEIIMEKMKDRPFSEREKKEISQKIALAAIRYSILRQSIGKDIVFDLEKSISLNGDSGPYLQYSLTRAKSILKKAKIKKIKPLFIHPPFSFTDLETTIIEFPFFVQEAVNKREPHLLVLFLTELAQSFNNYYAKYKILDKRDKYSSYRLELVRIFASILEKGLWLLGIEPLEKM